MEIRVLFKHDINSVVEIHKQAFDGFFLTSLGEQFLTVYYECLIRDKYSVIHGVFIDNELCGFSATTSIAKGFNSRLVRRNVLRFAFVGSKLLFTKPFALIHLFRNRNKVSSAIQDSAEYAELLSIGIKPERQGLGIGKQLILCVKEQLKQQGCAVLSLTTDYDDNSKAIKFYHDLGFSTYYDFVAFPSRRMLRLVSKLN